MVAVGVGVVVAVVVAVGVGVAVAVVVGVGVAMKAIKKRWRVKAGRKGGENGTGSAKRRDPEFYTVKLPAARAAKRLERENLNPVTK